MFRHIDRSTTKEVRTVNATIASPLRRWGKVTAALAVVTATALVVGVGVTNAKTQATVTLKLIAQSNGQGNPQLQSVLDTFQKKNPDIKIEATYLPIGDTYANTLRTQLRGGNAPDVFYVTPGSGGLQAVLPLAKAGYVADLSGRPWAKTIPLAASAKPQFWIGRKLYAVPIDVVPVGVLYHPDILSSLGIKVPTTMSQFLAGCRTAKAKGKYFLNVAGASSQNAGLLATVVAGSYVLAKDPNWNAKRTANKVTFAGTPAWRTTLQRILDMKNAGCFPPGAEANDNIPATPGFVSGQVASWVLPSSITNLIKSFNKEAQYNFFALPGDKAADTRVFASPSDAFAVYSKTPNKAAAMKFVDFWASAAASGAYAKATGASSVANAGTGQHLAYELRGIAPLLKQKTKVHSLMQLEWSNPAVFDTLGKDVQGLLTGQKTVSAVLSDLDAAWSSK
jgi:raffinose/stachyose/melibiose transport system substrate-binding protein